MKPQKDRVVNLPKDYILKNRYTQFLLDEGKRLTSNHTMICWYIGENTGRLYGVFWNYGDKHPFALVYNIYTERTILFRSIVTYDTWDELFDILRSSPKTHYTPFMPFVFSGCSNSVPRDNGKIVQFPDLGHSNKPYEGEVCTV